MQSVATRRRHRLATRALLTSAFILSILPHGDRYTFPMQPVSIVVTVLNEAQDIGRVVPSLLAQTPPAAEVIVVDGGLDATGRGSGLPGRKRKPLPGGDSRRDLQPEALARTGFTGAKCGHCGGPQPR